jgi:hypothetical protein
MYATSRLDVSGTQERVCAPTWEEGDCGAGNRANGGSAMPDARGRFILILASAMLVGAFAVGNAAPPEGQPIDPEMHKWYESLKQPGSGAGCCSIADCRSHESRMVGDHYEIFEHNRWLLVPNAVVLHRENKAGAAIASLETQWYYGFGPPPEDFSPGVLCFIHGPDV